MIQLSESLDLTGDSLTSTVATFSLISNSIYQQKQTNTMSNWILNNKTKDYWVQSQHEHKH